MEEISKQAWITSLRLLAATPKTRKELGAKLSDKGYPAEIVAQTLNGLESKGLLSDAAYARDLAAKLTQGKPSGRRKISFEMKRHGVPEKIQAEVLSTMTAEDESLRARELALMKWQQNPRLDTARRKKKVFDFLLRRGFDFQIVRETLENLDTSDADNE